MFDMPIVTAIKNILERRRRKVEQHHIGKQTDVTDSGVDENIINVADFEQEHEAIASLGGKSLARAKLRSVLPDVKRIIQTSNEEVRREELDFIVKKKQADDYDAAIVACCDAINNYNTVPMSLVKELYKIYICKKEYDKAEVLARCSIVLLSSSDFEEIVQTISQSEDLFSMINWSDPGIFIFTNLIYLSNIVRYEEYDEVNQYLYNAKWR